MVLLWGCRPWVYGYFRFLIQTVIFQSRSSDSSPVHGNTECPLSHKGIAAGHEEKVCREIAHTVTHFCQSGPWWRLTYEEITFGTINLSCQWTFPNQKSENPNEMNDGSTARIGENRSVKPTGESSSQSSEKSSSKQRDSIPLITCPKCPRISRLPQTGAKAIISSGIYFSKQINCLFSSIQLR